MGEICGGPRSLTVSTLRRPLRSTSNLKHDGNGHEQAMFLFGTRGQWVGILGGGHGTGGTEDWSKGMGMALSNTVTLGRNVQRGPSLGKKEQPAAASLHPTYSQVMMMNSPCWTWCLVDVGENVMHYLTQSASQNVSIWLEAHFWVAC